MKQSKARYKFTTKSVGSCFSIRHPCPAAYLTRPTLRTPRAMHFSKLTAFLGLAVAGVHAAPGGHGPPHHNPPPPPPPVTNNQQTVHCGSTSEPYCCSAEYPWDPSKCVAIGKISGLFLGSRLDIILKYYIPYPFTCPPFPRGC